MVPTTYHSNLKEWVLSCQSSHSPVLDYQCISDFKTTQGVNRQGSHSCELPIPTCTAFRSPQWTKKRSPTWAKHKTYWAFTRLVIRKCLQTLGLPSKIISGDFPSGPAVKNLTADAGDMGSIPGAVFHKLRVEPMHHNHWSLHALKPVLCNKKAPQLESSPDCCNYRKSGHNSENLAQPKINLKEFLKKIRVEWKPETKTYMDSIILFVKISSNSLFKPVFMVSERTRLGRRLIFLSASTSSSSSIILNKGRCKEIKIIWLTLYTINWTKFLK